MSPPDSPPNSGDDDLLRQKQGCFNLGEPVVSVKPIEQRRGQSPEGFSCSRLCNPRANGSTGVGNGDSSSGLSSDSDQEDGCVRRRGMVRKKSGEPVRPVLRASSARRRPSSVPGTPAYSKAVKFDSQLEHIRHFLQIDTPSAVSADTSPTDDHFSKFEFPFDKAESTPSLEWELRLCNFPSNLAERAHWAVRLERLHLSTDKTTLVGTVAVANFAFQKLVVARFTFDFWRTVSEVSADYSDNVRRKDAHDGHDRFIFSIKLADQANLEEKVMFVCIRYCVNDLEIWDNNIGADYRTEFVKSPRVEPAKHDFSALPRSKHSVSACNVRRHSMPPPFLNGFPGLNQDFASGRSEDLSTDNQSSTQNSSNDIVSGSTKQPQSQARQQFGNRYDFGASLSAAIRSKSTQDRTTLTAKAKSEAQFDNQKHGVGREESGLFINAATSATDDSRHDACFEKSKPSSLVSEKPQLDSSLYKEMVDKYCFVCDTTNARPSSGSN